MDQHGQKWYNAIQYMQKTVPLLTALSLTPLEHCSYNIMKMVLLIDGRKTSVVRTAIYT